VSHPTVALSMVDLRCKPQVPSRPKALDDASWTDERAVAFRRADVHGECTRASQCYANAISPTRYAAYSCDQLIRAASTIQSRLAELTRKFEGVGTFTNNWTAPIAWAVLWPALTYYFCFRLSRTAERVCRPARKARSGGQDHGLEALLRYPGCRSRSGVATCSGSVEQQLSQWSRRRRRSTAPQRKDSKGLGPDANDSQVGSRQCVALARQPRSIASCSAFASSGVPSMRVSMTCSSAGGRVDAA